VVVCVCVREYIGIRRLPTYKYVERQSAKER